MAAIEYERGDVPTIGVLGPVLLRDDQKGPIELRSKRQRLLLAVLVAKSGRPVTVDELIDALWADHLPERATAALQSQVHRLRQLLPAGIAVVTEGSSYHLDGTPDDVDAIRFERLVAAALDESADPVHAIAELDEALHLWRGAAYADVEHTDAIRIEAARLDTLRAEAAERLAEFLFVAGRFADAAHAAAGLSQQQPYREGPIMIGMRSLARAGRHVEALRMYDEFRRRLGEEIGTEPSPELRAVEGEVLRHERGPGAVLGVPGNSFVGREADLAEVRTELGRSRLVTLTGLGGVGKTRLAVHAASSSTAAFPDGLYLCELATLSDDPAVAGAVASTLSLYERGDGGPLTRVVEFLQSKRVLLVLDNCEHVLEGARQVARSVLLRTQSAVVLATSRQRLGVEGEQVFVVGPLATGDDLDPAMDLFTDRAVAAGMARSLSAEDISAISELCRRLQGLPLAIELAAARCVSLTPAELLAEVGPHLEQLGDEARAIARHRSLDATIGWSYDLLDDDARIVFRAISVFVGGCTAPAAASVIDRPIDVAGLLGALVDRSLVASTVTSGRSRFSFLEPVRQFAEARMGDHGEAGTIRGRHAAWAAAWMEQADAGLRSVDEADWAVAIDTELANLRAAHQWALDHDVGLACRIIAATFWSAYRSGPAEVFAWADRTVERLADLGEGRRPWASGAYATAALGSWRRGDLQQARALATRGIALGADDPESARFAWEALRSAELLLGNHEAALAARDHALALARSIGDVVHEAHAHVAGALALGYLGRLDEATTDLAAATKLLDVSDNPTARSFHDYVAGEIRLDSAPDEALPLLRRSSEIARRVGNRFMSGIAGASLVSCAARVGDATTAIGGFAEVIDHLHRGAAWPQLWTMVRALIETLTRVGQYEDAAVLLGALRASERAPAIRGADATRMRDVTGELRTQLGTEQCAQLEARGADLGDEQAMTFALEATFRPHRATSSD